MDPSDSHQPFDNTTITSTYVPEGVTAPNVSPLTTLTVYESNRDEAHVEPAVQPHVEPVVQPQVDPHAASESALVPAQPSSNRRPYTDMIYDAIVALKEPGGSTKWAISNYIKRLNPNVPDGHDALMTHHLEVMKRCGILSVVRKSYKLADSSPPENVAAAVDAGLVASGSETPPTYTGPLDMLADAVDTGLEVASGSEIPPTYTGSLDMVVYTPSGSASQPLKRGRGRPPKSKTEAPQQQQPIAAQPELPVTNPTPVVTEVAKRGRGRPRKDRSGTTSLAVMMKQRGWPMSSGVFGRGREPISVQAPDVAIGAERPEIPRRGGSGGVATLAPAGEEAMAVAAVMKRGPGRPPKRGRRRTAVRPIQDTPRPVTRATGTIQESSYSELKRKILTANDTIQEILYVLDVGIATGDTQTIAEVSQELQRLLKVLTLKPHAMEEVQPEEAEPQNKAETQGMELGQGSEGGGEQAQIQTLMLTQPKQPQAVPQLQPETLPQPQPQSQTLTLTGPEPQILHELEPQTQPEREPLPELEPLLDLEHLPLTQPQPQTQPNTEAEAMDEDMF